MSGNQEPTDGSWGKQCDPATGLCFNGPNTVWCSGGPDTGGCHGGGVGLINIMNLSREQIHASPDKFFGPWVRSKNKKILRLKLMQVGMLAAAGLQIDDEIVKIGNFNFSDPEQREVILRWNLSDRVLQITFIRDGVSHTSQFDNPRYN